MTPTQPATPREIVAREDRDLQKAAPLTLFAGVFTLLGGVVLQLFAGQVKNVSVLSALHDATVAPSLNSPSAQRVVSFHEHGNLYVLAAALTGAAGLLFISTAYMLQSAYKARRPEAPGFAGYLAIFAGVGGLISGIGTAIATKSHADNFVTHHDYTVKAIAHALKNTAAAPLAYLGLAAGLAMASAFVLVGINAMRVGLLSRFMGILGIIAGALFIVPLGGNVPIVQTFWLVAVGVLFSGNWPNGAPPAWKSGTAIPWPSNQKVREERAAAGAARTRGKAEDKADKKASKVTAPPPPLDPDAPLPKPHSASKKRPAGRKRRK